MAGRVIYPKYFWPMASSVGNMNYITYSKTKIQALKLVLALFFTVYLFFIANFNKTAFFSRNIDFILAISLGGFFVIFILSFLSQKMFWFLLPIVGLAIPNAINKIFPSIPMGISNIYEIPNFSFITHIDFYLIFGILRYGKIHQLNKLDVNLILTAIILSFLYLTTIYFSPYPAVALMGGYQLRYLFLLILIFIVCTPVAYLKEIQSGLIIGALILIFESIVFTIFVSKSLRLTSGNFGVNTYGHILSAIVAFLVYYNLERKKKIIMISVVCIAIFFTGTRFSILALISSLLITHLFSLKKIKKKILFLITIPIVFITFFLSTTQGESILTGLFSIFGGTSSIDNLVRTDDSSSIVTRVIVWFGTIHMIENFPFFGVGPAVWSYLKSKYGISFDAILDPHNDALNLIVSYGILTSSLFLYKIYFLPMQMSFKLISNKNFSFGRSFFAFNLVLMVSGLSNSVIWKHQVGFLFMVSALMLMYLSKLTETEFDLSKKYNI